MISILSLRQCFMYFLSFEFGRWRSFSSIIQFGAVKLKPIRKGLRGPWNNLSIWLPTNSTPSNWVENNNTWPTFVPLQHIAVLSSSCSLQVVQTTLFGSWLDLSAQLLFQACTSKCPSAKKSRRYSSKCDQIIWKSCGIGIIWKSCGIIYETMWWNQLGTRSSSKRFWQRSPSNSIVIPFCRALSILSFRVIACQEFVQKLNQTSQEKLWALNRSA